MKSKFFNLICCILFATSIVVCSNNNDIEIPLYEIVDIENFFGDEPLDSSIHSDETPPRPNQFHATINNNVLCVSAENLNTTTVVVKNQTGESILNQQFVGFTTELINSTGFHTIEIFNGNLKLVGYFLVQ